MDDGDDPAFEAGPTQRLVRKSAVLRVMAFPGLVVTVWLLPA